MTEYALLATAASKTIPWQAEMSKQRGKGILFKVKGSAFTKAWRQNQARYIGRREQIQHGWCINGKKENKGRVTNKVG